MISTYWVYLITAGLFEIGWPIGLKLSAIPSYKIIGPVIAVVSMTISGILLRLYKIKMNCQLTPR